MYRITLRESKWTQIYTHTHIRTDKSRYVEIVYTSKYIGDGVSCKTGQGSDVPREPNGEISVSVRWKGTSQRQGLRPLKK